MNDNNKQLQKLIEKYKLGLPVSDDMRKQILKGRKPGLKTILKRKKLYSFFTGLNISVNIFFRKFGIKFTSKRSMSFVKGFSLAFASIIIILSGALLYDYSQLLKSVIPVHEGVVTLAVGDIKLQRNDGSITQLDVGAGVNEGDTIITGENSFLTIQLENKAIIQITDNSNVNLKSLFTNDNVDIFLEQGQILNKVGKLKKRSAFKIRTLNAIAAVRGTKFSVDFQKDRSIIAVTEGKLKVEHLNNEKKNLNSGYAAEIDTEIKIRSINKIEELEIKKVAVVPFIHDVQVLNKQEIEKNNWKIIDQIEKIEKEIQDFGKKGKDKDKETKKKKSLTLTDLKKKYGRLVRIETKKGKEYIGAFKQKGAKIEVITIKGKFRIPSTSIKKISPYKL